MIEFMVLGAPRSATAWCANWLTTDTTLCFHEPMSRWKFDSLDNIQSSKTLGISCTVLGQIPSLINKHPARKVILHRDPQEVRDSMARLNIRGGYDFYALIKVQGMHCQWREVFDEPKAIYEYLLGQKFDAERHHELLELNIQNVGLIKKLQECQGALADG